jgi:hypothetical protein
MLKSGQVVSKFNALASQISLVFWLLDKAQKLGMKQGLQGRISEAKGIFGFHMSPIPCFGRQHLMTVKPVS